MAGSRQSWVEAPYCACPASAEDLASNLRWVEAGRVAIVPGMSCEDQGVPDVMRGEETQVFGALELCSLQDATVVLPGTHSKWVQVRRGRIQHFTTFMTGEFYALLKTHSILARTLPKEEPAFHRDAFLDGVAHAQRRSGLLHSAFSVRTLSLFDRTDTAGMHSYLSGLVIGDELRGFDRAAHVVLVGARELTNRYALALGTLGVESTPIASEATWHGLWRLSQNIGHRA